MRVNSVLKHKAKLSIFTVILFCLTLIPIPNNVVKAETTGDQKVKVRFLKEDNDYSGWNIWTWWPSKDGHVVEFTHKDEKGVYAVIDVPKSGELGMIIKKGEWENKATGDVKYDLSKGEKEIIITSGVLDKGNPEPKSIEYEELYKNFSNINIKVNYNRPNKDYEGWSLWNWITGGPEGKEGLFNKENEFGVETTISYTGITSDSRTIGTKGKYGNWEKEDSFERIIDLAYLDCNGNLEVYYKKDDSKTYYVKPVTNVEPPKEESPETGEIIADELVNQPGGKNKWFIAGSFQNWNNSNPETQLKHLVDGFFEYSTVLEAGKHEFKIVKNGTWDGFSNNGDNFILSLTEKTKVNFYVNEELNQVKINVPGVNGIPQYISELSNDKWPRLVGDIQEIFGEGKWSPENAKQMFVDYNFDGSVYKLQRNLPAGKFETKVAFGANWDESYGVDEGGSNLIVNTLDPADVIFTINYKGDKKLTHNYKVAEGNFDGLINKSAITFDSRSITYKKPFGAIKEESEDLTLRIGVAKDDVQVAKVELIDGNGVAKSYDMRKATTINETDYYEVIVPKTDFKGIGIWGYKFILVDGKAKLEYGDDGLSGGNGTTAEEGALPYNLTVYDKDYKTPDWMKESVVYQIFPDRFFDGNEENNRAKLLDGYRGYIDADGNLKSYDIQYYDGGVKNDPASSKVWGEWSDYPENPRHATPENKPYYPNSKTDNIWTNEFYGGDIQGIEEKLQYLKSIGISAIYLNPVAWAASNHKYDATDYKSLDPMFGQPVYNKEGDPTSGLNYEATRASSDRVYQAFAKAAEDNGIKLIADGVFNHVGDDSIYFDRYEKYPEIGAYEYWRKVWDKVNTGKSQEKAEKEVIKEFENTKNPLTDKNYSYPEDFKFTTWFKVENEWVIRDKDGNALDAKDQHYKYEGWWGYDSLPVMEAKAPQEGDELAISGNHEWNNVDYRENVIGYDLTGMSDREAEKNMEYAASQRWMWMGARGWRLDVAPDVSTSTWQKFREAVKSTAGRLDVNGNVIDDPVILGEEWGVATHYLLGDQFDSVMNYQFRAALQNYIISGNAVNFNNALEVIRENYPKEAWQAMLNLVDSHDTIRNITKIDNPTWEEENTKIAPEASDNALKLQALTAIFQMGYAGAPTIYYGDEVGVTGTKDPDSRRSFPWERVLESNGEYSAVGRYSELFDVYKNAARVRNENLDLFATGELQTAYANDNVIAYARKNSEKGALLVLNQSNSDKTIEADVTGFLPEGLILKDELYGNISATVKDGKVKVKIPAQTGLMMVSNNKIVTVDKVQGLKAKAEQGKVTLTWNEVSGATKYNIYRTNLEGQKSEKVGEETNTSFIDENVVDGTRYYYYVTAIKEGGESEFSDSVTALPSFNIKSISKPNVVKDLTIGVGNKTDEIVVNINIPGLTDNSEYRGKEIPNFEARLMYYNDETSKDNANSTKLRYRADLDDGSKAYYATFEPTESGIYKYYAKATTNAGDNYTESDEASMNAIMNSEDNTAPKSPILNDILVESNRAKLNWESDGVDVEGFEVYRKEGNGEFVKVSVEDKASREFVDFTVSNDKNYTYKVTTYDKFYNRAYSEEKSVTPTLVMVDVTLRLHIPNYTPATDDIYIAGDLNGWNASGGRLTVPSGATSRDVVEYKFKMMAGKSIQYKYTRGSWGTEAFTSHNRVQNDTEDYGNWAYSSTDTNMKLTVKNQGGNSMIVDDYVLRWVDMPMMVSMPRISYGDSIEYETDKKEFTLKATVPYGVEFTINDEDINKLYTGAMDEYGNVYVEKIGLKPGMNEFKLHIEPTQETIDLPWYTDDGRAGQATKTIIMKINCTAEPEEEKPEDVKVTGISLDKTSEELNINEILELKASISPSDATNKEVTWTSSDDKIAKVDANGKVIAVGAGKVTITVTTKEGGFKATCDITVKNEEVPVVKVTGVSLDKTSLELKINESLRLKASISPADATNKDVTWTSSDEKIAKVDANGKVIAVGAGKATITVTTKEGGFKATCDITVKNEEVPVVKVIGVSLDKTSVELKINESLGLKASISPADATNKDVTWTSSDEKIAKVDANGKVIAVGAGKVTITVTTKDGGFKATCEVNVKDDNGTTNPIENIVEKVENPNGKNEVVIKNPSNEIRLEIKDIESIKAGNGYFEIKNGENTIVIPFSLIDKDLLKEGSSIIFEMKANEDATIMAGIKGVKKVFEFNLFVKTGDNLVKIHNFKNGVATVTLKLTDEDLKGLNRGNLTVFYYNEETKTFEQMETTINGNEVTFKTSHFSKFIIAEKVNNESGVTLPATGGNNPISGIIFGFLLVLAGTFFVFNKKNKLTIK
ncbi:Ig-like domain-containing protein [Clostridium tertium]|uniref:Ig-like domain-containing protein n=4 Tax=Clostridium tertium TaxID=1559 RepID=UPI00232B84B1|nr:Ig-like domain-containing protein [Clostridium tertium]MDB1962649.1 Ig-like domain-containing protein [Clostridium tertium]